MNTSRDPDRLIHAFLQEGEEQLFDQVYDTVRAEIEHKRQRAIFGPWRTPIMNRFVTIGLAAAAVLAAVFIGSQLIGPPNNTGSGVSQPQPRRRPRSRPRSRRADELHLAMGTFVVTSRR